MPCAESMRVQAYFDGEVDAVTAADIERHVEHCDECRSLLHDLEEMRNELRRDVTYVRTPPELRARVLRALDKGQGKMRTTRRARTFWLGALSGIGASAIAAALVFLVLLPSARNPLIEDVVGAHLRSLMSAHLIDVVSTDQHTVKPWFAGHADVSPVVADFEQQGYRLVGGRADYLAHQRSAVVVYQHGQHVINVFTWASDERSPPKDATRNGYHLAFWKVGNLEYCAVSDVSWDGLRELQRLLQGLDRRE